MRFDSETLLGSYCTALSVPMYFASLQLLSDNGSDIYGTIAKKAAGLFCLGSAALLTYVPLRIFKDDFNRFKKLKSLRD